MTHQIIIIIVITDTEDEELNEEDLMSLLDLEDVVDAPHQSRRHMTAEEPRQIAPAAKELTNGQQYFNGRCWQSQFRFMKILGAC